MRTSILWKMLRRWVSTVFWLRNSSAAISGFVLRSTTSRATCSSRSVSDSRPVRRSCPAACAGGGDGRASRVRAPRLVAVAQRAAGVERRWRRAEARRSHGRARPAWASARPASVRDSAASIGASDLVGGSGRRERELGRAGRVAVVQRDRGGGSVGPGGGEGKLHGRGRGRGASGRALGLVSASEREPAARQQLEAVRPPAAGDERQLLATGAAEEQLDGSVRLPGFEQDAGEPSPQPRP